MPRHLDEQGNFDDFVAEYRRPWSDAARQVERMVLGHEVGLNGYTTVEQAQTLGDHLELSLRTRLLDVGAGRGWPGSYLAQSRGCRLVTTDLPFDALVVGREYLASLTIRGRAHAVSADGRALPFRSALFGAIVHADVFCWISDKLSVLRECHRVLERGGRVAGYVIHTPDGLSESDRQIASEFGPSEVAAEASPGELATAAGLSVIFEEDVTGRFRTTCEALLRARSEFEDALRAAEGDDAFEEEQQKKRLMLDGIDAGLLLRSAIVAVKP